MDYKFDNPAFVFGMFETGLAVGRSLGRMGVKVFGYDHKKDIGFYSRYIIPSLTPHPLKQQIRLVNFLKTKTADFNSRPVVFITSDDYLEFFVTNSDKLGDFLIFNIVGDKIFDLAFSKNKFYARFTGTTVCAPRTYEYIPDELEKMNYPVLVKGDNVNSWRDKVNSSKKVFIAGTPNELEKLCNNLESQNIDFVVQEIIPGNDNCFYKYCAYRTKEGEILNEFMLRKIRQNPVRYGVGSLVISCRDEKLRELGREVFNILDYKGIGSAEFKYDARDGKFKLIELNARYWQQNALADKCGINFPFIEYLYLTGQDFSGFANDFEEKIKWVNIYMDFSSFLDYRKEKELSFFDWIDQIKGKKVFSDFAGDDLLPSFYEFFSSNKLKKLPKYLNKIFSGE